MANNVPALKVELINLLTNTANLDGTTKGNLRDAFVTLYPDAFQNFLAANSATDTPANRAKFAMEVTVNFWRDAVKGASQRANLAALPAPNDIV